MPETRLTVWREAEKIREIPLDAKGALLGRQVDCDVQLESELISRHHARIYQDPFSRWIIEDTGSRNGVWVEGRRVTDHAILPGEKIVLGPFTLTLTTALQQAIAPEAGAGTLNLAAEERGRGELVYGKARTEEALSGTRYRQLREIADTLAELTNSGALYPAVCEYFTRLPNAAAVVLRLAPEPNASDPGPQVLACRFSEGAGDIATFHLSKRVLEAVKTSGKAVMAESAGPLDGRQMMLTMVEVGKPRSVFCVPMTDAGGPKEALYLDVPSEAVGSDMFDFIQVAARQVSLARKSLLLAETVAQRRVLDQQLEMARTIQAKLTPKKLEQVTGVDVVAYYQPAMWVGGDYCDMWRLTDGRLAFAVGDVSGKGLPAAMVMTNIQAALRATTTFSTDLPLVMNYLNDHLNTHLPDEMFVTLVVGIFDPADGQLKYVNAGHLLPLVVEPGRPAKPLGEPQNPPLGVVETQFKQQEGRIEKNFGLVVVTDGITESMAPDGEQFGDKRLEDIFAAVSCTSAQDLVSLVTAAAAEFRNSRPQQDDITVLGMVNR